MINLKEISELGKKPLPQGIDDFSKIMYDDDDYEELSDLFSASYLDDKNWPVIVKLAEKVFTEKTKHIQVLQWLCEALINTNGYAGLNSGINILYDLSTNETLWKTTDPLKDEKKASAIRNFEVAIVPWVDNLKVKPDELELINNISTKITDIKAALKERFKNVTDGEGNEIVMPSLNLLVQTLSINQGLLAPQETKPPIDIPENNKSTTTPSNQQEAIIFINDLMKVAENQAFSMASDGKLREGLEILQQGYSQASFLREKFFWTLIQVRLLYSKDKIELALFHLKILEKNIDQYKLEEWEPQISIDVAELFLKCCDKEEKLKKTSDREKAYNRLRRLDMARSLKFEL